MPHSHGDVGDGVPADGTRFALVPYGQGRAATIAVEAADVAPDGAGSAGSPPTAAGTDAAAAAPWSSGSRPGIPPASNSHSHDTSAGSAPRAATIVALAPRSPSSVQFSVVTGTGMPRHPQRSKSATSLSASSGRSSHCSVPRRAAATERLTF
ncbi:hypothetical protein [Streptosporangium canum]|uniref:hypothetical protein n=1 Tax=Streptosporangium canum TaxID=324952 RepID=UPI0037A07E85